MAAAFREAAESGDAQALARLLAEDAVLYTDGGGKRAAAFNPIHGADKILRFIAGVSRKNLALQTMHVRAATVNGLGGLRHARSNGVDQHDGLRALRRAHCCDLCRAQTPTSCATSTLRRRQRCRSPEVSPHSATAQRMRQLRSHQADVARAQSTG